jgi:hypothetical protein
MWSWILDEGVLEQCVGVSIAWQTMVQRVAVAGATMTGRLPLRPEGPLAGGAPPLERGPGGGALEVP